MVVTLTDQPITEQTHLLVMMIGFYIMGKLEK
jgi:hypothetical protein